MVSHTPLPPLPELQFARIPQASQHRYLGDRFSYMQAGDLDAPCLLMLHGIGANATYFRFQFQQLSAHFRVVAWNAPGYWMSDTLHTDTPNQHDYAQAVHDFAESLQLSHFVLSGNSFGSVVAQAFAAAHPHRVKALVLTGTGVGQLVLTAERRAAFEARIQRIAKGSYSYGDAGVDNMVGAQTPAHVRAMMVEVARGTQAAGLLRAAAFRLSDFYTPGVAAALTMPVLMLQGAEDRVNPQASNADLLLPRLAKGRLVVLDGVGHLPEIEVPELYAQHVRGWLAERAD